MRPTKNAHVIGYGIALAFLATALMLWWMLGCGDSNGPWKQDTVWIRSVDNWGRDSTIVYEFDDGKVGVGEFCGSPPLWKGMHAVYIHRWDAHSYCEKVDFVRRLP